MICEDCGGVFRWELDSHFLSFFNCTRKIYFGIGYSSSKFLGPVYYDTDSEKKNIQSKEQLLLLVSH